MKSLKKWLVFFIVAIVFGLSVSAESASPLPALAVTVDDYVYGSERSRPVVSGNLENGSESYFLRPYSQSGTGEWREITCRPVTDGMPTEGGRYELKVTVGATESYSGGSAVCDFYVLPTDLNIGLTVKESISFGDSCTEGELFTVSDLLGRSYSVTFSKKGSGSFTSASPTETGEYTLKISVSASNNYSATEATGDFEIKKRSLGDELILNDLTVIYGSGEEVAPIPFYTGTSEAVKNELLRLSPIAGYRPLGSDGEFSSAAPTEVGEYEMRVGYGESSNIYGITLSAVLRITKAPISPSVSIESWIYGETPGEPRLGEGSNPGRGRVYYYYRPEGGEYSTAFPTDAGKYTLKAVIEASDGYAGGEAYAEFTVEKAERSGARLVFGDAKYGETLPSPYVSGTLDGAEVVFSYSPRGENRFGATPPTESGEYTLRADIAEGKNYKAKTVTYDFVIEKADVYVSVFVEDRVFGEKSWTVAVSGNEGNGEYTLSYFIKTSSGYAPVPEAEMIDGRPSFAGEYKVVCRLSETKNHKGSVAEGRFIISRAAPTVSVSMKDYTFYGKAPNPQISGNSEGGEVSFIYYPKGGSISSGSYDISAIVTSPGEYTVAAVVSQTRNYNSVTVTDDFSVFKADLPVSSMSLSVKVNGAEVDAVSYGSPFELSLKNNVGYGAVSFSFQKKSGGDFTPEKPRAVGEYKVKATVATTDVYKSLTVFFDLSIVKAERVGLELKPVELVFGDTSPEFVLSGNTDELGTDSKSYSFKPFGGDDSEYTDALPTKVGKYTVKLTLSETDSYLGAELFSVLIINKADSVITAGNVTAVYSGEPVRVSASLNHSEGVLTFGGDIPLDVGEYTVTVSVPDTESYNGTSVTVSVTVVAAQGEINSVQMPDTEWNGSPISPPVYNVTGDGEIRIEYYQNGELLESAPTEIGEYTVKIILSDGKNYKGCSSEKTFLISAPAPVTEPESTAEPVPPENKNGANFVRTLLIILIIIFILAVTVAIIILKIRRDGGDPPEPTDSAGELPPSSGEGLDSLDPPLKKEALTDGRANANTEISDGEDESGDPNAGDESASNQKSEERLTDGGKIALDMWLEHEESTEDDGIVQKKGGRYAEINLDTVCRHFEEGETVDLETLKKKGLVSPKCRKVKLLGRGELTKKLDIKLDNCSKGAKESMEAFKS